MCAALFNNPTPLSLSGNLSENWKAFKQQFKNFMVAKEFDSKNEEVKITILLNLIGEEAVAFVKHLKVQKCRNSCSESKI